MSNHLANSISPYLLQHSQNPVDWYPWGEEALKKARREDKPIFLSIGYAACHWCHVMAHESFENADIAAVLNEHFVSIKVDREARPDLDSIYMSAVVALTGQGGWPMSVFLTPDLQPFYGGTYFPPAPRLGLPGFKELLLALAGAWQNRRQEITTASKEIAAHLERPGETAGTKITPEMLAAATQALVRSYDWENGGWGPAPKFPQPMAIEFLIRRYLGGDAQALKPAVHALRAMARGGMYDVVGGGFSRYSTDASWHVPHFEKMLYDNAQLARLYLHAWQVTHEQAFRRIVQETLDFVCRELTSPAGGFTSSLDADSEGEEGKYYVWTLEEMRSVLGAEADFFVTAYGVTADGNWEGRTVLQRRLDDPTLAVHFKLTPEQVAAKLGECHSKLLAARLTRTRPQTDDKVLTGWNGLMLATMAECGRVLGNDKYVKVAMRSAQMLIKDLQPDGKLHHAWHDGHVGQEVFLEDYAALILGIIELYQTDFNPSWFTEACRLADEMITDFADPQGGFFDTPESAAIVLKRPKDLQDSATPSGNALAAEALLKLSALHENERWRMSAEGALLQVPGMAARYPAAYAAWLSWLDWSQRKIKQVAIVGDLSDETVKKFLGAINSTYRPNLVLAAANTPLPDGEPALLLDRPRVNGSATAYLCEGFVCRRPVTTVEGLRELLA